MVDFTVAIPTYNGAERLPGVLEGLRSQIHLDELSWEIIVVDNNSSDETARVVQAYQANWAENCPLHYAFEAEPGAAFARQRAVEMAKGKYIGFLDDDNVPALDWVASAYAFAEAHPRVGAMGSEIEGDFSVPPPEYLSRLNCYLGIIQRGTEARRYEVKTKVLPPAAGLVVRREAWLNNVPQRLFLNHTSKDAGLASEDLEAVLYIQKAGWEVWHNPAMKVRHKIPPQRCEKEYLLSLVRCIGLSRHHLRMLRLTPWQRPLATVAYGANDLRKFLQHLVKYGNAVKTDVVVACDRELFSSILLSPFFLFQIRYQQWRTQGKKNFSSNPAQKDYTVSV